MIQALGHVQHANVPHIIILIIVVGEAGEIWDAKRHQPSPDLTLAGQHHRRMLSERENCPFPIPHRQEVVFPLCLTARSTPVPARWSAPQTAAAVQGLFMPICPRPNCRPQFLFGSPTWARIHCRHQEQPICTIFISQRNSASHSSSPAWKMTAEK